MLNKSDSDMSKSKPISNIRVYQFIREKCKTSIVEVKGIVTKIQKWIVMIVKDPWLKTTLIEDIEFKKSSAQLNKEQKEEEKQTRAGNCHNHPSFVVDIDQLNKRLTSEDAQAILQCSMWKKLPEQEMPKLLWACCLRRYGDSFQSCETGKCGLPTELEEKVNINNDTYISIVQEHFKKNASAEKSLEEFLKRYKPAMDKVTINTDN
ncbi:unnamed protein product [Didymodactylos carnosus]|uniref:Uncharacterized protein n=2 Tax=Didymodactylos carnosus TaxID=1234261 RepID=A0A8S2TQ76_9BILA|nr:unnamed protein product [Didymodactylos carnosus]CAF4302562.1 unnamed protein product [Didymodactylos carnosus]